MTERHSQRYRASLGIDDGDDSYRFLKDQKAAPIDGVDGYPEGSEGKDELLNESGKITQRVADPPHSATDAGDSVPLLDTSPASYFTGSPPEGMHHYTFEDHPSIVDLYLSGLQSAAPTHCEQPNDKLYQSADTTSGDDAQTIHAVDEIHSSAPGGLGKISIGEWEGTAPSGDDPVVYAYDRGKAKGREQGIREAVEWMRAKGETNGMLTDAAQMLRELLKEENND